MAVGPRRSHWLEVFEAMADGRTQMHTQFSNKFPNREDRDVMVENGMESGWLRSTDRLNALVVELKVISRIWVVMECRPSTSFASRSSPASSLAACRLPDMR
jgi:hypothetical protein